MWQVIRRNPFAAFLALIMHLALVIWLIFGIDWQAAPPSPRPQVETVKARVVDAEKINAEVERLRAAEARKEAERKAAREREEKRLAELKRRQKKEQQRLAKLEKERKAKERAEAKRRAEEKKRKAAEAKRLAELEKKRRAEEKRLAEAEKKRKADEARRRAEEEKRKQAEAEARRRAEAKRKAEAEARARAAEKKAREEALQAQLAAEQDARERDRYVAAIKQQIENNWLRPPSARTNLRCTLRVRLIPGGDVIAVSVVNGSGNAAFDRSVETAVRKAAPLPVPSGGLFESFRDLTLVFDPGR